MKSIASKAVTLAAVLGLSFALSGCSMLGFLWPFGRDDTGRVPAPDNATQYRCNSGGSFWLRKLSDGAMWVIYPDRQIRLDKDKDDANRYTNGVAVLQIDGAILTLSDGAQINYTNCTVPAKK